MRVLQIIDRSWLATTHANFSFFYFSSTPNGAESSLSIAEIQKLEEEREREAKMRRDIQEAAQARARQEEEARRQQVC